MGAGDELLAAGQARRMYKANGKPVVIVGIDGRPRWSPIWDGNPYILKAPNASTQFLTNGPHARPYIASKTDRAWIWKPFKPTPAEIFFTAEELVFAEPWRGSVLIEPNVKAKRESCNKFWQWEKWQALADMHIAPSIQVGPPGTRLLRGVAWIPTSSFRLACAILSVCRAFVGHEGGLHHAAAAVGTPAVVLFSGFILPEHTGYDMHRNLCMAKVACGYRVPCKHCRMAMDKITVGMVADNLREILNDPIRRLVSAQS